MPTRLLTVKEAASLLAEHPDTTRQRLREGVTDPRQLQGIKKGNGPRARWYVTEKALESYLRRLER